MKSVIAETPAHVRVKPADADFGALGSGAVDLARDGELVQRPHSTGKRHPN